MSTSVPLRACSKRSTFHTVSERTLIVRRPSGTKLYKSRLLVALIARRVPSDGSTHKTLRLSALGERPGCPVYTLSWRKGSKGAPRAPESLSPPRATVGGRVSTRPRWNGPSKASQKKVYQKGFLGETVPLDRHQATFIIKCFFK